MRSEAARKAADRARAALNASLAGVTRQQATVAFARTNRQRFEDLLKEKAVSASDSFPSRMASRPSTSITGRGYEVGSL